ncbi:MAG TPA: small ribosomal subunit Rsm22 family protein [Flexivirga sp.]|uniref:small ribosomal subunit Rsm22 family protein n=1 Tax=Flexivirga sp. TaxID=1962927 RepID=UPI002B70C0C0|nr:small ribosomal subunit Rsm22 family protein [Flexivirga sp.]HWC24317.1 small ribosomal subunit Rsm22 family protein [Flexivirga sp.]
MSTTPTRPLDLRLRDALDAAAAGVPRAPLAASVDRLIGRYREGGAASAPILGGATDVMAYALYRMPATLAACTNMLRHSAFRLPEITSVTDLGGGTGAAAWAAQDRWPDARIAVLDQVGEALQLGRQLRAAERGSVEFVRWQAGSPVPAADLVTVSYVLSELDPAAQDALVRAAIGAAVGAVAIIEPGTPSGHQRILAARRALLEAGWQAVAPCPHQLECPVRQPDWCHFSARVERSSVHRQLKGGELGHEDEKFSYVVAVPGGVDVPEADAARVLRHPVKRKGLVELQLCRPDGTASREVVTKRQGAAYKQARDVRWGDEWPPL